MSWLWGSSNTDAAASKPTTLNANAPTSNPIGPDTTSTGEQPPLTRDEVAEQELASFLREIEADVKPSSTKYNRVPKPPPPASVDGRSVGRAADPNISFSDSLLPATMSCRQTFDNAFYCQSFGGQFNNLYRYGGIRDCSELWSDFWFCMKVRTWSDGPKEDAIRDRYKRKHMKYKMGQSSEDVWKSRDQKLEWGEAFNERYEEPIGSDEEWNKREAKRRAGRVSGTTS